MGIAYTVKKKLDQDNIVIVGPRIIKRGIDVTPKRFIDVTYVYCRIRLGRYYWREGPPECFIQNLLAHTPDPVTLTRGGMNKGQLKRTFQQGERILDVMPKAEFILRYGGDL